MSDIGINIMLLIFCLQAQRFAGKYYTSCGDVASSIAALTPSPALH